MVEVRGALPAFMLVFISSMKRLRKSMMAFLSLSPAGQPTGRWV
jgi:hypothetical protein